MMWTGIQQLLVTVAHVELWAAAGLTAWAAVFAAAAGIVALRVLRSGARENTWARWLLRGAIRCGLSGAAVAASAFLALHAGDIDIVPLGPPGGAFFPTESGATFSANLGHVPVGE